jgi:hypothetical protein
MRTHICVLDLEHYIYMRTHICVLDLEYMCVDLEHTYIVYIVLYMRTHI